MFKRISVSHFKSIEHLNLELRQVNILVGTNGCGKSNIVDVIRFVRDAVHNGLDRAISDRHGIDSIRQWSPTRPYRVLIEIEATYRDLIFGRYALQLDTKK